MEKAAGLDHDHAGSVAARMAVGQPEELRRFGLLGHARSIDRELHTFNPLREPRPLWEQARQGAGTAWGEITVSARICYGVLIVANS